VERLVGQFNECSMNTNPCRFRVTDVGVTDAVYYPNIRNALKDGYWWAML
jgi:hypothetical protein